MAPKNLSLIGANAGRARNHNRQLLLGHIRSAGRIGRAEIARQSGLSTQAVSNIIADLKSDGLLLEKGHRVGGRGLPAVQFAINPAGGYALGIEIRPDALFATLLDLEGNPVFTAREALSDTNPEHVANRVLLLRDNAVSAANIRADRILGAGIVMPGPFGFTGLSSSWSELKDWQKLDTRNWFSDKLGVPVYVENDANAAAMAERISGAAKNLETYVFLYFGAGLGLGIVSNGRLMRGGFGNAGEVGHTTVYLKDGPVFLEQAVSRLSVQRHLRKVGLRVESGADLADLYRNGEPALFDWLEKAAAALSQAIVNIENLIDPQSVILGGAMPDAVLTYLVEHIDLTQRSVSNRPDRTHPRLRCGTSGRMTAALGAAALVINHTFTPTISAA